MRYIAAGGEGVLTLIDPTSSQQIVSIRLMKNNLITEDVREIRAASDFVYFRTNEKGWSALSLSHGKVLDTMQNTPL